MMGNMRNGKNGYENELNTDLINIGTVYSRSSETERAIGNDIATSVLYLSVDVAGLYFIHAQATFKSNKIGLRRAEIRDAQAVGVYGVVQTGASGSGSTVLQVFSVSPIHLTSGGIIHLVLHQNSGAELNVNHMYVSAIRLK